MKISKLYEIFKNNNLSTNILLLLILSYPISIVAGPLLIEITIFFSIIIGFLIFKLKIIKTFFLKFNFKYLLFFFISILISSLLSDEILLSLKSSFFSFRFFLFSVIILIVLHKVKQFNETFFFISLIFLIFCTIDGYIQLIFGRNIFLYENSNDIVTGLFFEEKKLGRFLITFAPILVGLYLSTRSKNINLKLLNSLIFLNFVFLIVLFTSERVSMFYASFTIIITIVYGFKISKKYLFFILIPFLILVLAYGLKINQFQLTVDNSLKQITDNNNSFSYPSKQHRAFIKTSYELFKENPLIGIGPNNYRNNCNKIIINNESNCSTHPHNILFQILAETGLIGLLFYIYFLVSIVKRIIDFTTKKKDLNVSVFFLLPLLYFLNPLLPSGNFFNNWFMAVGTFAIPFYLYFNEIKINKD